MEKDIRQSITDYKMPRYICEILCNHYAKAFLDMTIKSRLGRFGDRFKLNSDRAVVFDFLR